MKKITVYIGAKLGLCEEYRKEAKNLGIFLAKNQITLVYGGSNIGNMGILANTVLEYGGNVIGIFPEQLLPHTTPHKSLTKLYIVKTMHERKLKMIELSDAIIALPGGLGTIEELFEVITWKKLGLHNKPIGLLNTNNFWSPFTKLTNQLIENQFLDKNNNLWIISNKIIDLIQILKTEYNKSIIYEK